MRFAFVAAISWFTCFSRGGAEKQVYFLATALVRSGHSVDFYTMDIDESFLKDGVNVVPAWNRKDGIKLIRYFTHRIPSLRKKLLAGNYDLVYMRGYSEFSYSVVKMLRYSKTISAIGIASDKNLSWEMWKQSFPERKRWQDPQRWFLQSIFHKITLKYANIIITQNETQYCLAKQYGTNIVSIPNLYRPYAYTETAEVPKGDIAWIGGLRPQKGINSLFEIIDALPYVKFIVVGGAEGEKQKGYAKKLESRSNVVYIEHLDNCYMHDLLKGVKLLLNTSPHEGFPNTFLEAWFAGIQVASLAANPSNLLSRRAFGYCAYGDIDKLVKTIREDMSTQPKLNTYSAEAKNYVLQHHGENGIIKKFENLVENA